MNNNHHSNGSGTLEDRIVAALQDPNSTPSQLAELVAEVEQGLIDATTIADRLQECAVDLLQSPDAAKAKEAVEFATFVVKRLENVLPRLRSKHQQVVAQQRVSRWNMLADQTQGNRDTLVAELNEVYPQWVNKIIEIFERLRVMDQQIDHVNGLAPNSASRRLASLGYQQLLANSKLLSLTGEPLWPPPVAAILPQQVMPVPSHPGVNWAQAVDERNRERHAENQRVANYYAKQARDREDRENAAARAARERGSP